MWTRSLIRTCGCDSTVFLAPPGRCRTALSTSGGTRACPEETTLRSSTISLGRYCRTFSSFDGASMATSYTYRLLKDASWGIVITLGGDLLPGAILPPHALKISEAVWLDIDVGWRPSEEEVGFLKLGVNLVADEIERTCEGKLPIVVRVTGLQYTPSDYQPEGLAAAIAEWIAQQCGVPKP